MSTQDRLGALGSPPQPERVEPIQCSACTAQGGREGAAS